MPARPYRICAALAGLLVSAGLAAGTGAGQESGPAAGGPACSDRWYGGCPDSCTEAFNRLQRRDRLTEQRLEEWAARCVTTTEQQRENTESRQESEQTRTAQQSAGQQRREESAEQEQDRDREQEETAEQAEAEQSGGSAERERRAERGSGQAQSAPTEQEPRRQPQADRRQGQERPQNRQSQGERRQRERSAASGAPPGPQAESQEDERAQSNPPIGDQPSATPGAQGGDQQARQRPVPRGAGSTGRSDPAFERERRRRGLGDRYGGPVEAGGPSCRAAEAPLCTGYCRAGVCAPAGDGSGCICRPARTPTSTETRRRALCARAEARRLRVSVCRAPDETASASCAAAASESPACEPLWTAAYDAIDGLEAGRLGSEAELIPVPLWDWAREDTAIDTVSVPLGESGESADPRSVWESAQESMPASDLRVFLAQPGRDTVRLLERTRAGDVAVHETPLSRENLPETCREDDGEVCARDRLARLRMTLLAQAPEARILANHSPDSASWYGECAAARLNGRAQVVCYQVTSTDGETARAWRPLKLGWLGANANAAYAQALIEAEEWDSATESASLGQRFFQRAAAAEGESPPLLLAAAREADAAAYARGDLPAAVPETSDPLAGLLIHDDERLLRLTGEDAPAELAPRNRTVVAEAMQKLDEGGDPALARLAGAAVLDPDMIALSWGRGVGACLRRSRPEAEIACFHERESEKPAIWRPLAWPAQPAEPRIDRQALLAATENLDDDGASADGMLERVFNAAVTESGRYLRLFDLAEGAGETGGGSALAFRHGDPQARPLFETCKEEALFFTAYRRAPVEAGVAVVSQGEQSCAAAFPETYAQHRKAIQTRLRERLAGDGLELTMRGKRAMLRGSSPDGIELVEVWSTAPEADRRFPRVTAGCLMRRAEEAAGLAPGGSAPARSELERALLAPDWREQGWRANPLGLVLRAESCKEDA